jgi:hypothetical protein
VAGFAFDDGTGSQTLSCSYVAPANRFRDWTPVPKYIGQRAIALGDRRRYQYVLATSQAASFRLPGIPVSNEAVMRDFILHAEAGGLFTITTDDAETNTYADCQLASDRDGEPIDIDIAFDPELMEYTLGLTAEHVGTPQEELRAVYLATAAVVEEPTAASYAWTMYDADLLVYSLEVDATTYAWTFADCDLTVA